MTTRATLSEALYARQMQFTWDHIHYLEVSNILHRVPFSNCCGGHLVFRRMPQINNVRGRSGIKALSKMKSIRHAVFILSRSQAISCIGYNVNLQTAVAAILVFIECPKSIASEVLVVLRPNKNV